MLSERLLLGQCRSFCPLLYFFHSPARCSWVKSVVVQISNDRKWPIAHLVTVRFPSELHKNLACMMAMKHDEMKRWLEAGTDTVRRLEATLWWRSWHFLWSYGGIFKHGFYLVFWQVASLPRSSDIPGKYPLSIPIHHNSLFSPEVHSLDAVPEKKWPFLQSHKCHVTGHSVCDSFPQTVKNTSLLNTIKISPKKYGADELLSIITFFLICTAIQKFQVSNVIFCIKLI